MSDQEITVEQAQAVLDRARREALDKEVADFRRYIGRFFKFRNSYSDGERWWLYGRVEDVQPYRWCTGTTFQLTSRGVIEVESAASIRLGEDGAWVEIDAAEYDAAARALLETISARLSAAAPALRD